MLDGIPVLDIGAKALVSVIVLMLLTDRLVTRKRLEDKQRESDTWREAAEKWRIVAEKGQATGDLIVSMLRSLTDARRRGGDE